ncbi:ribonuclease R [Buchnera aphidicola]|uniref:ribonuclease R n=1 Tax=Buchnera aphidicola TaxID=9 RepID=UPI0034642F69
MVVDSYQKKENKKYNNIIPCKEKILFLLKNSKDLINQKKIELKFNIYNQEEKIALHHRLKLMQRNNQIIRTYNDYYITLENKKIVQGQVIGHRDGYGFLRTEKFKDDIWLSIEQMKLCIHGDIVVAHIIKSERKGKKIAKVLKRLKPNKILIIGQYYIDNKKDVVIPNDSRFNFKIFISKPVIFSTKISIGSIVVVNLKQHSIQKNTQIKGRIVEVLGKEMETNLAINIALRTHCIPYLWSEKAKKQLSQIKNTINKKDLKDRIDLRHIPFFTIDEEDARDFDDAIFCKKKNNGKNGWILWVAIADVSYYIKPRTALDKDALKRGNSIYFPSLVIPMLPEKISIDICSLNPNVERLCLICEMNLSNKGELLEYKHYEAVICSHGRFTYNEIFKIWNGDPELCFKYKNVLKYIQNLSSLQEILKRYNISKKGIYFENIETKFILDTHFRIKKIYQNIRNDAHKFIESCMILANVASAKFIEKYQLSVLFRNHDCPSKDSVINFRSFLKRFKLSLLGGEVPKSIHYSNFLKKIINRTDYEIIQNILLRSMKQAVYDPENRGHFGLSLSSYVHFTSPIRRYPDLITHRVIKKLLLKEKTIFLKEKSLYKSNLYNMNEMKKIGIHCSMTERRADEATRDVIDWLKCDFMKKKIGNVLTGVISNVTTFGFFVRLNQYFIDGLVRIASLSDDYYYFDSIGLKLIGKFSKNTYCLGDILQVKVIAVNINERKIELSLCMSK